MAGPFLRRLLLPIAILYVLGILLLMTPPSYITPYSEGLFKPDEPLRVPIQHPFVNTSSQQPKYPTIEASSHKIDSNAPDAFRTSPSPITPIPSALFELTKCPLYPNRFTGHIRLPNLLYNISMTPIFSAPLDRVFWNPTILALPSWAKNQYIIVNMVASHGDLYRKNVLCEANICHPTSQRSSTPGQKFCAEQDLEVLGPNGGLRCVTGPIEVKVPSTPAEKCEGVEQFLADIPGFHDPRLFYSGRGEPILMVASQYDFTLILWRKLLTSFKIKIRLHWTLGY